LFSLLVVIVTTPRRGKQLLSIGHALFASPGLGSPVHGAAYKGKAIIHVCSSRNTYTNNENVCEIKLLGKMVVLDISSALLWTADCVSRMKLSVREVQKSVCLGPDCL
jgi:hypothetical protein